MISFTEKDVVVLDFDNTIWIWRRNMIYGDSRPDFTMRRLLGTPIYSEAYGFIPEGMSSLIKSLIGNKIDFYILTACKTSMEFLEKQSLLTGTYGIDPKVVISVGSVNDKLEVLEKLMIIHANKNLNLVDDRIETLKEARTKLGISVYHPLEILCD